MKAFIAIVCLGVISHISHSQVLIGPVAGLHAGSATFDDKDHKDVYSSRSHWGYHAGGSVSLRMHKQVFLQTSILYSKKGKHLKGKEDKTFDNKVRYHYIEMPISFSKEFKMHFGKGRFYNLYFGAGPTVSYWLGGKGLIRSGELNENGINPPDYELPYKVTFGKAPENIKLGEMNVADPNRFQFGLNFSTGVVFEPVRWNKFMLTLRYDLGHSFFSRESKGDFGLESFLSYQEDMKSRYQGLAFSLFYYIDLKTEEKRRGKSTIRKKNL